MIWESNDTDVVDWLRVIHKHHISSKGYKLDYTRVAVQKNFWKSLRISEEDYIKNAWTGDILLFRGKSFFLDFKEYLLEVNMIMLLCCLNLEID